MFYRILELMENIFSKKTSYFFVYYKIVSTFALAFKK
nr:MAG TPA: hypothetical protein [Caudoviricetes sp.]